jgi:hypothetical protein
MMIKTFCFVTVAALSLIVPVRAGMMLLGMGKAPGGGGSGALCNVSGVTCQYAFSVDRRVVTGATNAFAVYDGTTMHDVGFLGNGTVNMANVYSGCYSVQDCYYGEIFDQTGNGCNMVQQGSAPLPLVTLWPAHGNLPSFWTPQNANSGSFPVQQGLSATCTALNGNVAKSLIGVSNSMLTTAVGGRYGLFENPPGVTAYSAFANTAGGYFPGSTNIYGGVDIEGANLGILQSSVPPISPQVDQIEVTSYNPAVPNICLYYNGAVLPAIGISGGATGGSPCSYLDSAFVSSGAAPSALVTQSLAKWGAEGDQVSVGSEVIFEGVLTSNAVNSTAAGLAYTNANTFYGGLTAGPEGPGDLFPVIGTDPVQIQLMVSAFGLRPQSESYVGSLLELCQGTTGICENVGLNSSGVFDTAGAMSFCGPTNCTIQIAYNQAFNPIKAEGYTHDGTNQNMVAAAASTRPTLTFNCNNGLPCMTSNGAQSLCAAGATNAGGGSYTITAVAERTGGASAYGAIWSNASAGVFIGFANSANTAYWQFDGGPDSIAATGVADNTMHSLTGTLFGTSTGAGVFYVDGASSSATAPSWHEPSQSAACLFEQPGGTFPLTGNIEEVSVYGAPPGGPVFPGGFTATSGQVASIRTNQKTVYLLP